MDVGPVWQRLFPQEPHHIVEFQAELARRALQATALLDLGCGDNTLLQSLRTARRDVWGVDFQRHPQLADEAWFRKLPADGAIPFADGAFDLVAAQWVLEHVEQPAKFLREIERVLRPGGVFVAHSINGRHWLTKVRRLLGLLPHRVNQQIVRRLYGRAEHDTFATFYRLNTPRQFARACSAAGLEVAQMRTYADPGYYLFHPAVFHVGARVDRLLEKMRPGYGRIYFSIVLRKPLAKSQRAIAA